MTSAATLRQWVRYAAEVLSPKTHCGTYPWLMDWPQLKPACLALVRAAEAGESTAQLVKRIQQHLPDMQAERAAAIATSEAHTSMQAGSFAQMQYGGCTTKTWITAGDEDVRDSHRSQNGVTVPIDQPFPNGLMYPGDPSGSPGEIINCRCDMIPGDL